MSDEEPHDGQESATMHCGSARARARRASMGRVGIGLKRWRGQRVENDLRQSGHRYRCFG